MSGDKLRNPAEMLRDEMAFRDKILELATGEGKTIPEFAEALGAPTEEVTYWVMALRRYGHLQESEKSDADGYFRYKKAVEEEEK